MCNEVARRFTMQSLSEEFAELRIPLRFPEGVPNLAEGDRVRITDRTSIVRAASGEPGFADVVVRRWSWRGPGGRPVYNYRSDGRDLRHGRCLVPVSGFYEYTAADDPSARRKTKWLFTARRGGREAAPLLGIAGIWRDDGPDEAFALLTTEPGEDVAPYHSRQVVVLARGDWRGWLDGSLPAAMACRPAPSGTLAVERVGDRRPADVTEMS